MMPIACRPAAARHLAIALGQTALGKIAQRAAAPGPAAAGDGLAFAAKPPPFRCRHCLRPETQGRGGVLVTKAAETYRAEAVS